MVVIFSLAFIFLSPASLVLLLGDFVPRECLAAKSLNYSGVTAKV